ncbi:MAG: hypothetical protein WCP58_11460 [bacterium]
MQENPVSDWELRIGQYRVFYDVDIDYSIVRVLAVGEKEEIKLTIGGKEVAL